MHIIPSLPQITSFSLRESSKSFLPSLTLLQKRILIVSTLVFGFFTAAFLTWRSINRYKPFKNFNSKPHISTSTSSTVITKDDPLMRKEKKILADGTIQQGTFENDQLTGFGRITFLDGKIWEGTFQSNQLNGSGKVVFPDGQTWEGTFKNNELEGEAIVIFANGETHVGTFAHNKLNGYGQITSSIGQIDTGMFKDGLLHGNGQVLFPNKQKWTGIFEKNTLIEGQVTFMDGETWEGTFKNHQMEGIGKKKLTTGQVQHGVFKKGQLQTSIHPQIITSKKQIQLDKETSPLFISEETLMGLLDKLGPSSTGLTENYIWYMRKLLFGFSFGQKKLLDKIDPSLNMPVSQVQKMLQGGDPALNFIYILHFLDKFLSQNQSGDHSPEYLKSLKKLQSSLKRSLPFAFAKHMQFDHPKSHDQFSELASKISQALKAMQSNERLLIPTGVREHATLMVLQKQNADTVIATYYNTGLGVENHVTQGFSFKSISDHFNSFFYDQYPLSKTYPPIHLNSQQPNFETLMIEILKLRNQPLNKLDKITAIFQEKLGHGKSNSSKPIQKNEVCSFQVLTTAIKDIMGSKVMYNTFKKDLLFHIQTEFQEITNAMKPLMKQDEEIKKVFPLHEFLLKENQKQIESTKNVLAKLK